MSISMTSLITTFNQLVNPKPDELMTPVLTGSLQDHLMSISRPVSTETASSANELSAGPPPLYRKNASSNVVGMPKKKGGRVIVWTQVPSTHQAA